MIAAHLFHDNPDSPVSGVKFTSAKQASPASAVTGPAKLVLKVNVVVKHTSLSKGLWFFRKFMQRAKGNDIPKKRIEEF